MLHAVIMAGGSGTRFWPASRRSKPKQFLQLAGDRSLIRTTFERIVPLVPADRIWIVTTAGTAAMTLEELPELSPANVLAEPVGRDTAACVGFAALAIRRRDPEAICVVLPADHVIRESARFRRAVAAGAEFVAKEGGLLTFGIRPTRPETGFGYLELGGEQGKLEEWTVHRLARFVEKPNPETARGYLEDGGFLWNSGIFVWSVAELLEEIARQLPLLGDGLDRIATAMGSDCEGDTVAEVYPTLQRISVDYGIMEGARRCWTIPVKFPWSDVGSWPAVAEMLECDDAGHAVRGRTVAIDCADCVLIGERTLVAAAGVKDLIVVATPDAVLVVPAHDAQRVKELVAKVEENGWDDVL